MPDQHMSPRRSSEAEIIALAVRVYLSHVRDRTPLTDLAVALGVPIYRLRRYRRAMRPVIAALAPDYDRRRKLRRRAEGRCVSCGRTWPQQCHRCVAAAVRSDERRGAARRLHLAMRCRAALTDAGRPLTLRELAGHLHYRRYSLSTLIAAVVRDGHVIRVSHGTYGLPERDTPASRPDRTTAPRTRRLAERCRQAIAEAGRPLTLRELAGRLGCAPMALSAMLTPVVRAGDLTRVQRGVFALGERADEI